jgi:tetratricopeptide (TPR) repeat protein
MEWMSTAVMLMAISLVTLQGILLYARSGKDKTATRYAGILNLLLAISAFSAFFLFSTGALILSPEYGVLLAQGTTAQIWSLASILGISIGMGLALHAARDSRKRKNRLRWLVAAGLIVGIVTASRMQALNTLSPSPFQIRCIDLWTYPFIVWIVLCLSEWIFTSLRVEHRLGRVCGALSLLTGFALTVTYRAQLRFVYADSYTIVLWRKTAWLGVPGVMSILTWILLNQFVQKKKTRSKVARFSFALLAGVVGLWTAALWGRAWTRWIPVFWKWKPTPRDFALLVWGAWLFALILLFGLWLYRSWRRGEAGPFPDVGRPGYADDVIAALAIAAFFASIFDLSHSIRLDPVWDLAALILSWVVLLEIIGDYPLGFVCRCVVDKLQTVNTLLGRALSLFGTLVSWVVKPFRELFRGGKETVSGFAKIVVVVLLIVVASEIPNAGKTIVLPFSTVGLPDSDKGLGDVVSDRIVNTIALAGQDLQPDLLVLAEDGKAKWVPASSEHGNDLNAETANSNLPIPGTNVSIPLGLFLTPIEKPMRWLLGVRVIKGSVQREGGKYVLLASSSTGQSWRTETGAVDNKDLNKDPSLQGLADQLAYKIVTSDPALFKLGMTSSWRALQAFSDGLKKRREFEQTEDYGLLTDSINLFRTAVQEDPGFAMAHYRLGLALLDDGQPLAAVDAFRKSLSVRPTFVTGHIALAQALFDFESYYYPLPAALADQRQFIPEDSLSKAQELMQHVILDLRVESSFADRAAAYAGLCRNEIVQHSSTDKKPPDFPSQYVEFFYCKRAEYLYSKLSPALRADPRTKDGEALVLYLLGKILDQNTVQEAENYTASYADISDLPQPKDWRCSSKSYEPQGDGKIYPRTPLLSTYLQAAGKYYRQALTILPEDPEILCGSATASLPVDKGQEMLRLYSNDQAHFSLAEGFAQAGDEQVFDTDEGRSKFDGAAMFYRRALDEYEQAIEIAPHNVDALNEFAYVSWRWRLVSVGKDGSVGPTASILHQAEEYARRATRLTEFGTARTLHAEIQSTLGEILLAQSRPYEAIEVLHEIVYSNGNNQPEPRSISHAVFDEIRWDLAEAYLCAAYGHPDPTPEMLTDAANAVPLFDTIRENETYRERRFLTMPHMLDAIRVHPVCRWAPETAVEGSPHPEGPVFELEKTDYSHRTPCAWVGVFADAVEEGGKPINREDEHLYLHVWGGGIDQRISVGEPRDDVWLSSKPRETRYFYFAQLEKKRADGTALDPVSKVYPFETHGNENECQQNLIWLKFKRVHD